jgi:hypothetical protein
MNAKSATACGIFTREADAVRAYQDLQHAGFRATDVSVLFLEGPGSRGFSQDLGGLLGPSASMGAFAIPGVGPFIAAGPIMARLAESHIEGAIASIAGCLTGFGVLEHEAALYEEGLRKGGLLLCVHSSNAEALKIARRILGATSS